MFIKTNRKNDEFYRRSKSFVKMKMPITFHKRQYILAYVFHLGWRNSVKSNTCLSVGRCKTWKSRKHAKQWVPTCIRRVRYTREGATRSFLGLRVSLMAASGCMEVKTRTESDFVASIGGGWVCGIASVVSDRKCDWRVCISFSNLCSKLWKRIR